MSSLQITCVNDVHLGDIYKSLVAGEVITIGRTPADVQKMPSLLAALAAGDVTLAVTYSADELASGMLNPDKVIEPIDLLPVAAATALGGCSLVYKAFAAAAAGMADDVTVFAVDTLPFKFRIVDAWLRLGTAIAMTSASLEDEAADAGVELGTFSTATAGRVAMAGDASALLTPSATKGLFLRRGDRGVAGEVFVLIRPEV